MPTFLYAPGIKVYIQTSGKHGLVDVSDDLSSGTMVRRSDGVSTFDFTMNNTQRKYDQVFTPNDRIVVLMKRVTWLRTYTGLLNSVPLVSVWPRDVNIRSTCSLKRLQYWYWDPNHHTTVLMMQQALAKSTTNDGGIAGLVVAILENVVGSDDAGWPRSKVHIGKIPDDWMKMLYAVAQDVAAETVAADAQLAAYEDALTSTGAIGGSTLGSYGGVSAPALLNGKLQPGTYGGVPLDAEQAQMAQKIYETAKGFKGASNRDIELALACAMDESSLRNLPRGDRDSVGLFQQRPSQGWGTISQLMDPTYSTSAFLKVLVKIGNRTSLSEGMAIQTVQRSGTLDGSNYTRQLPVARALYSALSKIPVANQTSAGGVGNGLPGVITSTLPNAGGATYTSPRVLPGVSDQFSGEQMVQAVSALVQAYNIPYVNSRLPSMGSEAAYIMHTPPPPMDCSLLVWYGYVKVTGITSGIYPQTGRMMSWLRANGGRKVSISDALNTPGAWLFCTRPDGHVELSTGDGQHTIAATNKSEFAKFHARSDNGFFQEAWLMPGLTYKRTGRSPVTIPAVVGPDVTGAAADGSGYTPTIYGDTAGFNAGDKFSNLFGNANWMPGDSTGSTLASLLTGHRALMNDQPLLMYLKNILYSSLRSFCSAPNGDLIAWFPDYYGLWGTAGVMQIAPIELRDFTVDWSDDSLVTHMFTTTNQYGGVQLDLTSGGIATPAGVDPAKNVDMRPMTAGVATIDMAPLMRVLFGIDATEEEAKSFANFIYQKFGARPAYEEMPGLVGPQAEFFSAIFKFMFYWAYQYNANVDMTFMPELFPGMLIQIPEFAFQAYVTTVTHTFDMADGGGFHTTVNICAPARLNDNNNNVLLGMVQAGDFASSRTSTIVKK